MMRAVDLIKKKRDGLSLSKDEIEFLIHGYVEGRVPDYQMAALAMAIYFKGMTLEEIRELTISMLKTGQEFDLSPIPVLKLINTPLVE